jgi:propanediol dehydratase large subunit
VAEQQNRFISERLSANLAGALRLLDAAERALSARDVRLANVVLGFEADARTGVAPTVGAVRGDAAVEGVLDLAMRVADLARIAWRTDRVHPAQEQVLELRDDVDSVRAQAATAMAGGFEELSTLTRVIARADARAAAMARQCNLRRLACPAC